MPTSCQSDTCQGNGECRKSGGVVKCICGEGWSGYTCGERQCGDMCVPGTCDKGTGLCTCQQGYLGDDCSQSVTKVKVSAPVDMWVIILICVLGVLVLVVGGLLFGCRKRCYAAPPKPHPYEVVQPSEPPQYYTNSDMYSEHNYNYNLLHMTTLNASTSTLDNEIKL